MASDNAFQIMVSMYISYYTGLPYFFHFCLYFLVSLSLDQILSMLGAHWNHLKVLMSRPHSNTIK